MLLVYEVRTRIKNKLNVRGCIYSKGNNTPYMVFDRSLVHENTRILALLLQQHDRASRLIPEPRTWEKSNKSS